MEKKVRYNWPRIIIICVVVFAIGYAVFLAKDTVSLLKENSELKKQNKHLVEEKKELTKELKNVNTPEYIEEQAKLQLKLIRPGETLFILGDDSAVPGGYPSTDKEKDTKNQEEQGSSEGSPQNNTTEDRGNNAGTDSTETTENGN